MTPILPDLTVRSDVTKRITFFQRVPLPSISAFLEAGWEIVECRPSHHDHFARLMRAPDVSDTSPPPGATVDRALALPGRFLPLLGAVASAIASFFRVR